MTDPVRKYSSISQQTTLTAGLNSSAGTMIVASASALLGSIAPASGETFTVVIDPDTAFEEIVDVIYPSVPGTNTLTILRGIDSSSPTAHSAGAQVRHMGIGRDFREANSHITNTTSAHGLTIANVVSTTDTGTVSGAMIATGAVGTVKIDNAAVTEAKIGTSAVTTTKIADANVTTAKIADLNVTTGKIADSAITSAKIADLTIATGDIADSAITSAKIADLTIVAGDIADGAITSAKILDGTIVDADINAAAAIAKTKIAGTAVTQTDTGTVTSIMIADGTIVNADINTSAQIAYGKLNLTNSVTDADISATAGIANSKLATNPLARANHTGTQLASTISDFDTQVRTSRLDQMTAPTASVALNAQKITGLATPTLTTDAATKGYVDTSVSNLVASAPAALDTLNELAASLGNDANFATTVTNNLATKLPLAGGTMSGSIAMGTNKITGLGTPTTSTDAATKGYVDTTIIAPTNLTGPITSTGNVTAVASQTGTGTKFVMDTSPTLVTPNIGVATATSINGTTIPTSKTLVATDSTAYVVPSQTGNDGKYLKTDGSTASWATVSGALAQPTEPASPTDGQVWVNTSTSAVAAIASVTRWSVTPAAGTTSLSGVDNYSFPLQYKVGYEMVHLNGALLSRGNDYTATSGTSITLTNPTAAGDIVEVICPNELAYADTYSQTAVNNAFQANTNNFAAGKNGVINGGFDVWQRGTSFTCTGYTYTADRWLTYGYGAGTTTITQQTFTPGTAPVSGYEGTYFLRVTSSSGVAFLENRIEDVRKFAGQTVTLSFWAKSASGQTLSAINLAQNFGTGGSTQVTTSGTAPTITTSWARYTITIALPSITGKTIGTSSYLGVQIQGVVSNALDIWGVQLEAGSNATAFQTATGTIQGELAACQRYYYRQTSAGGVYMRFTTYVPSDSTTAVYCVLVTPVSMRTVPTSIEYANLTLYGGGFATFTSATISADSTQNYIQIAVVGSGMTQYRPYAITANNTSSAYLAVSSEL